MSLKVGHRALRAHLLPEDLLPGEATRQGMLLNGGIPDERQRVKICRPNRGEQWLCDLSSAVSSGACRFSLRGRQVSKALGSIFWLNELGAKVIGYSCGSVSAPSNFELCGLKDRGTHVAGDICDLDKLKWTLERHQPLIIIHLAAQSLVKVSYEEPKRTFDTNVGGTVTVLEAIRQTTSVKVFVGITTDKVYEDQGWVWGYRENDLLGGYEPYSASKAAAELVIQSYRRSWAEPNFSRRPVAIATARGGNVLGGGDFSKSRLVPDCMCALMDGTPIKLRHPQAIRPWQHVLDLLSGYLWLAANLLQQKGDELSEAWNFGPAEDQAVTCETVVRKAIDLWGHGGYLPAEQPAQGHDVSAEVESDEGRKSPRVASRLRLGERARRDGRMV